VVGGGSVVAAGRVRVAALVRGHHHAAVRRQPLHPFLHAAVAVSAPEIAPATMCTCQAPNKVRGGGGGVNQI